MSGLSFPGFRRQVEVWFAIGNLVPALVLGVGCWALPERWWGLDVPIALLDALLVITTAVALSKRAQARRVLTLAAALLLATGALLVAAFVACFAFLSGVHGAFGNFGALLMLLVLLLVAPYSLFYPMFELWSLGRIDAAEASGR